MKLGLISDIHGDVDRLKTALDLLNEKQVDRILCMGDVVFSLKQAEKVVDLLAEQDICCVKGNHDRWYLEDKFRDLNADKTAQFLSKCHPIYRFDFESLSILLAHGTPWSDMQEVTHNNLPLLKLQFSECCSDTQIVILGHSHRPMHLVWNKMMLLNPGSVCKIYDHDSATCAVLLLPECEFEVLSLRNGKRFDVPLLSC